MSMLSRLFVALGGFLIVTGIVYGVLARDYEGLALSMTVAGGALLVGAYGLSVTRRAEAAPAGAGEGADEPHVGPTIWPLVFAVSMIGLVVGAVTSPLAALPGAVFLLVACVGWVADVHQQWHHHAAGHAGTTAGHAGTTAGHAGTTTDQAGTTTDHAGTTTDHAGTTTDHARDDQAPAGAPDTGATTGATGTVVDGHG